MPRSRPSQESRVLRQVRWRLIPFLFLCYILNYLDRTNIGMAALTMRADLGFSDAVYAFGAGMFFVGYAVFEIPSNLILERVGARFWIARIMVTWGVISAAMVFARTPASFYALRLLLGIAEAGFFPGIIYYLAHWIPRRERAAVAALFLTSTSLSGVIGGPLSGAILSLDGMAGLKGWQWIFLLEGIPSVVCGFAVLRMLDDHPSQAAWLAPADRAWLTKRMADEHRAARGKNDHSLGHAMTHPKVWLLGLLYFSIIISFYAMTFWTPLIVKSLEGLSNFLTGSISALPFVAASVAMVLVARRSDRTGERRWHLAASAWAAAAGFLLAGPLGTISPALTVACLCLAGAGIWSTLGPFWSLPTEFLTGTAAAGGIALINSLGALGGFVGPNVMAHAKALTGDFTGGFAILALTLIGAGLLAVFGLKPPAPR